MVFYNFLLQSRTSHTNGEFAQSMLRTQESPSHFDNLAFYYGVGALNKYFQPAKLL